MFRFAAPRCPRFIDTLDTVPLPLRQPLMWLVVAALSLVHAHPAEAARKDRFAPSVSITSPASGSKYSTAQTVTITAAASDNVGVGRVEFYRNGTLQATDSSAPYTYGWSVTSASNGTHTWTAAAFDAAGNSSTSSAVTLTVSISTSTDTVPPTTSITNPSPGATYTASQTVVIAAAASDNVGVSRVEFYRNNVLQSSDSSAPYAHNWPISSSSNGTHAWTSRAFDPAGNAGASSAVSVTVNISSSGDTTAPTTSITSPASGSSYTTAQTVTIAATASDNVGVSRVEFYRNNVLQGSDTTAPYSFGWSITSAINGTHSWTTRAFDAAGNSGISATVSLTVNISSSGDTTPPTAWISSPASGSRYTTPQIVTIAATASDNVGVSRVEFYDNGVLHSTDTGSPYTAAWSVSSANNGSHEWTVKAYDAAGNVKTSEAVEVFANVVVSEWTLAFGGSGDGDFSGGQATAIGPAGEVFVAANQSGTADYDGGALTALAVVAKYSASGAYQWSRGFTSAAAGSTMSVRAAAAAGDGSVIVAGYLRGSINFGGGPISSANASADVFVVKFSSSGAHVWSKGLGSSVAGWARGIAVDGSGSVFVAGEFMGTINLGGSALTAAGGTDAFLAKYSSSGGHVWSLRFGGAGYDSAQGVTVDSTGSPSIAGYFEGSGSFGSTTLASLGGRDLFVASVTANGIVDWAKRGGGAMSDEGRGVAADGSGNLIVIGMFQGTASFGGASLTSVGTWDGVLVKYTVGGSHQWSKRLGNSQGEVVTAVAANLNGDIGVTGYIVGDFDLGGGYIYGNGSYNVFVAKFVADGAHRWSVGAGQLYDDNGFGVAVDDAGEVVATGTFKQGINFGTGALTNVGGADAFLVRFKP